MRNKVINRLSALRLPKDEEALGAAGGDRLTEAQGDGLLDPDHIRELFPESHLRKIVPVADPDLDGIGLGRTP
ncbi:MAG: hypothetical protein HGB33_07705, partial [Syntrophaceae bacterium]|nr:hypothetical protein [Syntrophaceae bacterium]